MQLLDLFAGAGGAAAGYMQAGFVVTGIDHLPQPRYPGHAFVQADALAYLAQHGRKYDCIHASPPCQRYANVTRWRGTPQTHPDLLPATRALLDDTGVPWVIENVPGAPMRCDVQLCGSQFGLRVQRHRWFMLSLPLFALLPPCQHRGLLPFMHKGERAYADAMGCQWMHKTEARQAIPPAYTAWLGYQLRSHLEMPLC
jgi:DNA (cytosine-5)-methyltransferase 1